MSIKDSHITTSAKQQDTYTCSDDVQAAVDSMHAWFETGKTLPPSLPPWNFTVTS